MMALVYRGESAERLMFKSELGLVDIIGHFVLWVLLTIVSNRAKQSWHKPET